MNLVGSRAYTQIETREELSVSEAADHLDSARLFLRLRQKHRDEPLETVMDRWDKHVRETWPEPDDGCFRDELCWAAYWALSGMPTIKPSRELCASFMTTVIPQEAAQFVRSPWPAFACIIPAGLISFSESRMIVFMSKALELAHHHKRYPEWAPGENMRAVIINGDTDDWNTIGSEDLSALADYDYNSGVTDEQRANERLRQKPRRILASGEEQRFFRLISRALFGCCAEFDSRAGAVIGPRPKLARGGRGDPLPTEWVVKLTRDVNVNCVQYVKDYLGGKRGSLAVQHMVRGHWKNQPYGEGAAARKFIHVEPYWRGPTAAPIAVRAHVMRSAAAVPCTSGGEE